MDEVYSRNSVRERILNDLKNIVKQVYHESANNDLSPENKTYICLTLIKNLDEALRYGLRQLHLGYWRSVCEVLHPQTLQAVENLPLSNETDSSGLTKGKAWIALSLRDDSFNNYVQCLINEGCLDKYYEDWSILRLNDACNSFLSILSGLDNVRFTYEVEYMNKSPRNCNLGLKTITNEESKVTKLNLNESKSSIDLATSSSSLTSPVDSGVHVQDSLSDVEQFLEMEEKDIDIDLLNGNVPEPVLLRKQKKNEKRHVSFHEDIICKSPDKCRKLKWDSENLRYSWSGEEIDSSILKNPDFSAIKNSDNKSSTPVKDFDMAERGTPEGQETPAPEAEVAQKKGRLQKSIMVKRFLQSIKNHSKVKHKCKALDCTNCNYRKLKLDMNLIAEIDDQVRLELENRPKPAVSRHEVEMEPTIVKDMIRNQSIYKTYKLRDYLFIITNTNVYLINKNLEMKRINLKNFIRVVVYPDSHVFILYETDAESHTFVTGDAELTNEVLGRLEFSMRRNHLSPPEFQFLDHGHFALVKRTLVEKLAIDKRDDIVYCGAINLDKENDLLNSILPSTKRGFLMYRYLQGGEGWMPGDFCLKNGILYHFGDDSTLPKLAVNVATGCQSCNRTKNVDRPHTFQLTLVDRELDNTPRGRYYPEGTRTKLPKSDAQRLFSGLRQRMNKMLTFGGAKDTCSVIEFAAANEYELSEWLQMIIQASCGDSCEEAHKENLTEGTLWLTSKSLIITNEIWWPNADMEIISCAQLRDVAAFKIGESEKDFYTVIEFICMEANSTSGDWILYLSSRSELNKLTSTLRQLWKFKEKFPCLELKEGRLLSRCKRSQENLMDNCWTPLLR